MPVSDSITLAQDLDVDGITMTITGFSAGDVMSLSYEDSQTNANPTWYHVTLPAATSDDVTAAEIKYAIPDDKISTAFAVGKSVVTCNVTIDGSLWYKQVSEVVVIGIPPIVSVGATSNSVLNQVTVNSMVLNAAMMSKFENGKVVFSLKRLGVILSPQQTKSLTIDVSTYDNLNLKFDSHLDGGVPELQAQVFSAAGKTGPSFSITPMDVPTKVETVSFVGFDSQSASGEFFYTFNNQISPLAFSKYELYWNIKQNNAVVQTASFELVNSSDTRSVQLSTPLAPGLFQLNGYIKGYLINDEGVIESVDTMQYYTFDSAPAGPSITLESITFDNGNQTFNLQCDPSNTNFSYAFSLSASPPDTLGSAIINTTQNLSVSKTFAELQQISTDSPIYLHAKFARNEINGYTGNNSTIDSQVTTFGDIMPVKRAAVLDDHVVITGYTSGAGGKVTIECDDYIDLKIIAKSVMNGSTVQTLSTSTSPSGEILQFNAGVAGEAYTIRIYEETLLPTGINIAYWGKNGNRNALVGHKRESTSSFTAQPTIESVVLRPVSPGSDNLPYTNSQVLKVARMKGDAKGNLAEKLFVIAQSATGNQVLSATKEPAQGAAEMTLTDNQVLRKNSQSDSQVVGAFEHDFTFSNALGTSVTFGVFDTPSQADAFKYQASGNSSFTEAGEYLEAVSQFNTANQAYLTANGNYNDIDNQPTVSTANGVLNGYNGEVVALKSALEVINGTGDDSLAALNAAEGLALTDKNDAAAAIAAVRAAALTYMNKMIQNENRVETAIGAWPGSLNFSTASGETHSMISWIKNSRAGTSPADYVWSVVTESIPYASGTSSYTAEYLVAYADAEAAIAADAITANTTALEPTTLESTYTTAVENSDAKVVLKLEKEGELATAESNVASAEAVVDAAIALIQQINDDAAKKVWGAIDNNRAAVTQGREDVSDIPASVQLSDGTSVEPKARPFYSKLNEYHPINN